MSVTCWTRTTCETGGSHERTRERKNITSACVPIRCLRRHSHRVAWWECEEVFFNRPRPIFEDVSARDMNARERKLYGIHTKKDSNVQ
jgi:hypothetical protein